MRATPICPQAASQLATQSSRTVLRTSRRATRLQRRPPPCPLREAQCAQQPALNLLCRADAAHASSSTFSGPQDPHSTTTDAWDALAMLSESASKGSMPEGGLKKMRDAAQHPHTLCPANSLGRGNALPQPAALPLSSPGSPRLLFAAPVPQPVAAPLEPRTTPVLPASQQQAILCARPPEGPHIPAPAPQLSAPGAPMSSPRRASTPRTRFAVTDPAADQYAALPVSVSTLIKAPDTSPPPRALRSFNDLKRKPYAYNRHLLARMLKLRYNTPLPVQRVVIPALAAGRDVCATSPTGTGKTGAYLLPLLAHLLRRPSREGGPRHTAYPPALILAPTRELVAQINDEVSNFIKGMHLKAVMLHGGDGMLDQIVRLQGGCDLIIATPGRLLDLVFRQRKVHLGQLSIVVVDEADKMLGLGLEPEVRRLLTHRELPDTCQTVFMATSLSTEVAAVAASFLRPDAVTVAVGNASGATPLVRYEVLLVAPEDKPAYLESLLKGVSLPVLEQQGAIATGDVVSAWPAPRPIAFSAGLSGSDGLTVIFTNSMQDAQEVHAYVTGPLGLSASLLHSGLTQALRDEAMQCFRYGVTPILVTTSLAARGMDVPDTYKVINWDVPWTITEYVHRCGRTGRGGQPGVSVSLFTTADAPLAPGVISVMQGVGQEPPAWLLQLSQKTAHWRGFSTTAQTDATLTEECSQPVELSQGAPWPAASDRDHSALSGRYTQRTHRLLKARNSQAALWPDLARSTRRGTASTPTRGGPPSAVDGDSTWPSDAELLHQWEAAIRGLTPVQTRIQKGSSQRRTAEPTVPPGANMQHGLPDKREHVPLADYGEGLAESSRALSSRLCNNGSGTGGAPVWREAPDGDPASSGLPVHAVNGAAQPDSEASRGALMQPPSKTARSQRLFDAFSSTADDHPMTP